MYKIENPTPLEWSKLLQRPTQTFSDIEETVKAIFKEVQLKGNKAILKYTSLFDGITLSDFIVTSEELQQANNLISNELKLAIQTAKNNIERFHFAQKTNKIEVETSHGVLCWQEKRPIQKVGLYIPGGSAPLFSTVLMLAVPAKIAGCKEIILCTPPDKNGNVNPAILYAAQCCGVTKIYKIGGIQAIASMTFGTETVEKVYKIFGPGNQFVTLAKQYASQLGVAIDMPAGPSELLVFADDSAIPSFVASDLLSQAEHGPDSQVILVTTSKKIMNEVAIEIEQQLEELPRRSIAQQAINNSKLIYMNSEEKAIALINEYGPEHFIICAKNEDYFVNTIQNAGSIFIGNFTPESAGDYASGTNHTLPTNGYSKSYSGVNLDSFLKSMTFQKISEIGLQKLGKSIEIMAEAEGLQAHKNAISIRLKNSKYE
ncbi:bifunctional histidinal dehydrogenase and histidinol dehydrogenase [Flavobacterium sp. 9AF]|uniref:histidinol dehydrogenase n=1 Tax=Flavobacterium sp. 9AF TaxID=2653142 RepID=UPI0012EFB3D6|nr:histidinol dehydrogenase [Flavobacterium sp. 9AF]VXC42942.1 bifunctional histidinal dehydrogenase and histidinol dehydrogenase [Flavobacterium sp. 9AF]